MCKVPFEENLNIRLSYFYSLEFDTENGEQSHCTCACTGVRLRVRTCAWGLGAEPLCLLSVPAQPAGASSSGHHQEGCCRRNVYVPLKFTLKLSPPVG